MPEPIRTRTQLIRFAIVGFASNIALFIGYLVLVQVQLPPKGAATIAYALGVAQSFWFNKRWSFENQDRYGPTFAKYVISYAAGYVLNMIGHFVCVDHLHWSHAVVQGMLVILIAGFLFLMQKFWVFRHKAEPPLTQEASI